MIYLLPNFAPAHNQSKDQLSYKNFIIDFSNSYKISVFCNNDLHHGDFDNIISAKNYINSYINSSLYDKELIYNINLKKLF
jgi:hypothetical protein